jgi:transmembrane sensor
VAVVEGSVRVEWGDTANRRRVTLGPRDMVRVSDADGPVVRREAPVQRLVAWRDGRLDFDDAPLPDVLAEIARWYGVPIRVADSVLARRTFSSTFPTNDLDEVVDVLELALGADVTRAGDTLVLTRRRAP